MYGDSIRKKKKMSEECLRETKFKITECENGGKYARK